MGEEAASVFPLARVVEPVKITMPNGNFGRAVWLDNGEGRAFDAPRNPQFAQHMAHQRCFVRAQIAMQKNQQIGRLRLRQPVRGQTVNTQ